MKSRYWSYDEEDELEPNAPTAGRVDPNDPLLNPTVGQELAAIGQSIPPAAGAAALNALQGPSFGWSDEIMSAIPGGERLEQFRQERNQVYPGAAVAAELGGALATGVAAGPKVAAQMARLPAPWMSAVGDTVAGAGAAGLYSLGAGEEGNRTDTLLRDSAIGAVAAPLANVATRVGTAAVDPIAEYMKNLFRTTEGQASSAIGRRMSQQGVPTDVPAQQARQAEVAYPTEDVPYINADTDPVQAQYLKELYDRNPSSRAPIEDSLRQRQRSAPNRVVSDIAEVTGLPRDTRVMLDDLALQSKRSMAREGYGQLQDQTIPLSNNLLDMFTGPESSFMRRAYQNAESIAAREGNPIPRYNEIFGEDGSLDALPLHALDYMQRAFRNAGKPNIANPNYDNVSWRKLRDRFLGEVDAAAPDFAKVRQNWATASSLEDATRQGQDIYKLGDARDIADYMATLSGPEQMAFRRGALDAIEGQVRNMGAKSGNVDTRLAGTQNKDEILDLVFGDKADGIRQILAREDRFNSTFSQILGGSATSKNLGDAVVPFKPGQGIGEMVTGQIGRVARQAFQPSQQVLEETITQLTQKGYTRKQAETIARQQLDGYAPIRQGQSAAGMAVMGAPTALDYFFGDNQ